MRLSLACNLRDFSDDGQTKYIGSACCSFFEYEKRYSQQKNTSQLVKENKTNDYNSYSPKVKRLQTTGL